MLQFFQIFLWLARFTVMDQAVKKLLFIFFPEDFMNLKNDESFPDLKHQIYLNIKNMPA